MIKRIHLGLGLELETIDTDYAKTLTLINNEARRDQDLLFKLKDKNKGDKDEKENN